MLKNDLVRYSYYTGSPEMKERYNINEHYHGLFECDLDDFKSFFNQVKNGGEVSTLFLHTKKGLYVWRPAHGWICLERGSALVYYR